MATAFRVTSLADTGHRAHRAARDDRRRLAGHYCDITQGTYPRKCGPWGAHRAARDDGGHLADHHGSAGGGQHAEDGALHRGQLRGRGRRAQRGRLLQPAPAAGRACARGLKLLSPTRDRQVAVNSGNGPFGCRGAADAGRHQRLHLAHAAVLGVHGLDIETGWASCSLRQRLPVNVAALRHYQGRAQGMKGYRAPSLTQRAKAGNMRGHRPRQGAARTAERCGDGQRVGHQAKDGLLVGRAQLGGGARARCAGHYSGRACIRQAVLSEHVMHLH